MQKIKISKEMQATNEDFCGIAFISFHTEQDKQKILDYYRIKFFDRIKLFFNNGMTMNSYKKLEKVL